MPRLRVPSAQSSFSTSLPDEFALQNGPQFRSTADICQSVSTGRILLYSKQVGLVASGQITVWIWRLQSGLEIRQCLHVSPQVRSRLVIHPSIGSHPQMALVVVYGTAQIGGLFELAD